MASEREKYDSNGDYGYSENFKRRNPAKPDKADSDGGTESEEQASSGTTKAGEYVRELLKEKMQLNESQQPIASKLIDQEITKAQATGKVPPKENKYVDIYREKPIKVTVKVLVPVKEHPKFNFVGKLLGPKGNSMKRLQEETMCKMAVLGRGSMRDRAKEDELRSSLDPKYAHLNDDLHVEISALGPPAESHARIAFALAEVRKYLIPDNNDNIRQEQMREMEFMTNHEPREPGVVVVEERRRPVAPPPGRVPFIKKPIPYDDFIPPPPSPFIKKPSIPHDVYMSPSPSSGGSAPRSAPVGLRTATRVPVPTPRVMPAKTKIMSILDRARVAMEESYGYEDPYADSGYQSGYSSSLGHSRYPASYEPEYETSYYRESSSYEPSPQRWKYKTSSSSSSLGRPVESSRYRTSPYTRPSK